MSVGIVIKNFEHFNRSLPNWDTPKGVYVKNKDHYDRLMKKNGMVSYEEMQNKANSKTLKPYVLSDKAKRIIKYVKMTSKSGKVKLGSNAVKALKEIGAIKDRRVIKV